MTPNPVCYNGLNLPNNAIHAGHVSLGIVPKDYRADSAQNWRAGISPDGAVVLYSNTYELGLTNEASAEPRIWWTYPAFNANDFRLKITELLSRLPERANLNYQVFASYDAAIDWLHNSDGKYALINDDYPEYYLPGEYCIFNIESGLLASYPASGQHIHTLANPNVSVGNQLNPAALSWHGFTLTNVSGELNFGKIGQEPGLAYDTAGHIISIDDIRAAEYQNKNLIFEAILRVPYSNGVSTIFTLLDSNTGSEIVRFEWDPGALQFSAHYPTLGSLIEFEAVTIPWSNHIHLAVSIPVSNEPESMSATKLSVDGALYQPSQITGSNFVWNSPTYFQVGNNRALNKPITSLKSAKAYIVPTANTQEVFEEISTTNFSVFNSLY